MRGRYVTLGGAVFEIRPITAITLSGNLNTPINIT